jgi:hypothetical protein
MIALGYFCASASSAARTALNRCVEQIVPHGEPLDGRADILAAAAGVQPGHVRPADFDQRVLDHKIVPGPHSARTIASSSHLAHGVGDARAEVFRHNAALDLHDGRSLVDLAQPVERVVLLGGSRYNHHQHPDCGDPSPIPARIQPGHRPLPPHK